MIAHDSRGTPEDARALSAALAQRLRRAIDERWRARGDADVERAVAALGAALEEAAAEARQRGLHPEELILAMKAIERDVAGARGNLGVADRRALRSWLVTACIRAYFSTR
jgi:hypothetical protein